MRRSYVLRHFALEDWVDLARESLSVEQKSAMLRHAADCSQCVRTLRTWRRVAAIGRTEVSFVPPEEALRAVKSDYLRRQHPLSPAPESLLARMVFDSFRARRRGGPHGGPVVSPAYLRNGRSRDRPAPRDRLRMEPSGSGPWIVIKVLCVCNVLSNTQGLFDGLPWKRERLGNPSRTEFFFIAVNGTPTAIS